MKIVIAFIENDKGQLLITKRASDTAYGGYWEFPGGKLESSETPEFALKREILEELNLDIEGSQFIAQWQDTVHFTLYHVTHFTGELRLQAGQSEYQWVLTKELENFIFPPRNQYFIEIWKNYILTIPNFMLNEQDAG